MDVIIPFGIGCFNFGIKRLPPFKLTGKQYIADLKSSLELIPNISDIKINVDERFESIDIEVTEPIKSIEDGFGFFPPLSVMSSFRLQFNIYIPFRIQKELYFGKVRANTENFRVYTEIAYHFIVTYIELLNSKDNCSPSDGVIVIREFLKKQFKKTKSNIRFECLGPSPFHADFFIKPGRDKDSGKYRKGLHSEKIEKRGYNLFNFYYDSSYFSDTTDLTQDVFKLLLDEVSLYYNIVLHDNLKNLGWEKLETILDDIIDIKTKKGINFFFYSLFLLPSKIRNAVILIAEYETSNIWADYFINSNYKNLTTVEKPLIDSYFKELFNQFAKFPTKQLREIIDFLERSRTKTIETIIIIMAALIGGSIGALITFFFTQR